jgi:hypothetical protein
MAFESRMQPYTMMPVQPFFTASSASWSPTSAQRIEAPPSITSTRLFPALSTALRTKELSSKIFSVVIGPPKDGRPP